MRKEKNPAAVALGSIGGRRAWRRGQVEKMKAIVRENGKRGGRPRKTNKSLLA